MDDGDLLTGLNLFEFLGLLYASANNLFSVIVRDLHTEDASCGVHLPDHTTVLGAGEDLDLWSIFCRESSELTSLSQHNNQSDVSLIKHCRANS